ncbi:MAG: M48 family metalloprotease [Gemmatimonadota bacterium]|nr:MAG: M48 family metalloprotease [Gemmatimonadota bacterium]
MPLYEPAIRLHLVVLLTGLLVVAGCAVNPATGQRQFSLISEAREIDMGREADRSISASLGLYESEELQEFVRGLGNELAQVSERPRLPWSFKLVDDPTVNAFALPGGFIYVTRGILAHLNSEAELAGVLGHEIGHVTAKHSVSRMSRQQLQQIGLGVGMAVSSDMRRIGDVVAGGLQLLNLKYSRGDESQSDELGMRYMTRAGYDPNALRGVFRTLGLVSGGSGRLPEWQSTHPAPENREARIIELIAATGVDYSGYDVDRDGFLRRLEGLVYGDDPREGYFSGVRFKHPDRAFRIDFPGGWKKINQKTQVIAVSPREDALLSLTPVQNVSGVGRALDRFLDRENVIGEGERSRQEIGGYPATRRFFRIVGNAGRTEFEGLVAFVDYRGSIYRILAYSVAGRYGPYAETIVASVQSFARLRERAALNVRAWTIGIVRVPSTMSFSEFMEAYPGPVDAEEVARLNRVKMDSRLERGRLMKRVRGRRLR